MARRNWCTCGWSHNSPPSSFKRARRAPPKPPSPSQTGNISFSYLTPGQLKVLSWCPIYVTLIILISSGSGLTRQPSGDPLPRASRFVWPELHWSCSLRWPLRLAAWLRLQRGRMVGNGVENSQCVFIASRIVTCTHSYIYDPETCRTAVPVCGRDARFTWRTSIYPSWLGVDPADHSGTRRALQVPKNFLSQPNATFKSLVIEARNFENKIMFWLVQQMRKLNDDVCGTLRYYMIIKTR